MWGSLALTGILVLFGFGWFLMLREVGALVRFWWRER